MHADDENALIQTVPEHLQHGIRDWVDEHIQPGHFLTAVIDNNLSEAVGRADAKSLAALGDIVRWFYNHAPSASWGSVERRKAWAR